MIIRRHSIEVAAEEIYLRVAGVGTDTGHTEERESVRQHEKIISAAEIAERGTF